MARKRYLVLIGLVVLAFIFTQFNMEQVIQIMLSANPGYLVLAIALVFFSTLTKTIKWQQALGETKVFLTLGQAFRLYLIGFFLSIVTPGRVGDFARAWYIKKKARLTVGLASVFFDRLFDVGSLIVTGIAGILLFGFFFHGKILPIEIVLGVLVLFGLGITAFFFLHRIFRFLKPLVLVLVPDSYRSDFSKNAREFYDTTKKLLKTRMLLAKATVLSIAYILLAIATAYLLAQSIGLELPWLFLVALVPSMALADLLPISILGLGSREVIVIYAFSLLALPAEMALSFSFLMLTIGYLVLALVGFVFFILEPLKMPRVMGKNKEA
ncbi:flippase-like domain-containing protein [Candidatus Micrarchaeota archaeon]|nr:flippase-like domain-containing protein [Candidatus Micrarchaeota archaeon]MBU1931021.1 flippase-like domain-containing protein [Candidatus Micrarchaeota archaeon]